MNHDNVQPQESTVSFYKKSIHKVDGAIVSMGRDHSNRFIMVLSAKETGIIAEFSGEQIGDTGIYARKCPLNHHNAEILRKYFPWTAPVSVRNRVTTIGCGDRLGFATLGHIAAAREYALTPVLAQQTIRELQQTGRTFNDVVDDVSFHVFEAGFKAGFGANADHLKSMNDIDTAAAAGITMFTIDLVEKMDQDAVNWDIATLDQNYAQLDAAERTRLETKYLGREFAVGDKVFKCEPEMLKRCAMIYGKGLDFAAAAYDRLKQRCSYDFDFEVAVDEASFSTLPCHHLFIAHELKERQVEMTSFGPRFIGDFQKGIDYIGDVAEFERQFTEHVAIAKMFGYKVSIHSGSDKFALYPAIGRISDGHLHIKTSGTSWLEAIRVIAFHDPVLYRVIHKAAQEGYPEMSKVYHTTADISNIRNVDELYDDQLPKLLDLPEARQMLHITFGVILNNKFIRPLFFAALHKYEHEYIENLKNRFEKHIQLLGISSKLSPQ